ncbi:helix-turn-helix domain-containing protein [Robbsia betulipollinis]|uniref:helix-turn-helix domain-containing protein n=1 Tax=Robbsia betulipollinis TaxID=2981849 RepID=UPI003D7B6316
MQPSSAEERAAIMIGDGKGASLRSISTLLGRKVSSINRELSYVHHRADRRLRNKKYKAGKRSFTHSLFETQP